MTFNNRIIRKAYVLNGKTYYDFSIREVYYDNNDNTPTSWTADEMKFVGESVKDIWTDILFRLEAFKAPVLDLVTENGEEKLVELK